MKYICTHCTDSTGEEHTFNLDRKPSACPYCGTREDYHLKTIEAYLRTRIDDLEFEVERLKSDTD